MKSEQLLKAFDSTTLAGKLVSLNNEQADQFIDYIEDQSVLIKKARLIKMTKPTKTIAKLFSTDKFLRPGTTGAKLADSQKGKLSTDTVELVSKLVKGAFDITDEELQDNIEGQSFEEHLVRIIAEKVANETEDMAYYGIKQASLIEDIGQLVDGWRQLVYANGHKINAASGYADRYVAKDKMIACLKSIPAQFRKNAVYFMNSDAIIDYRMLFDTIADSTVRGELTTKIMGKDYVEVPLLSSAEPVLSGTTYTVNGATSASTTVIVTDATGITAGTSYLVYGSRSFKVTAKATNTLTLDKAASFPNSAVLTLASSMDGMSVLLTDPRNLIIAFQTADMELEFERIAGVGYTVHFKTRVDVNIENADMAGLVYNLKSK